MSTEMQPDTGNLTSEVPPTVLVQAAEEAPPPPERVTFAALGLEPDVQSALDEMGYLHPTDVQVAVYGPVREGNDLLVQSRTGTGKTTAFGLPLISSIDAADKTVQALILAPTRELAIQVSRELRAIGKHKGIAVEPIYGGAPIGKQIAALQAGVHIVVGTPGRVQDHLNRRTLDPKHVKVFVLDECDEMLSMGFLEDIERIGKQLSKDKQTLLFSATMPDEVQRYAKRHMKKAQRIALSSGQLTVAEIHHAFYIVSGIARPRDLLRVLFAENPESCIIFCNTRDETTTVARYLKKQGLDAEPLSSDLSQAERERVMTRMKDKNLRFLVATDVAARGIDISDLSHVINFSFPEQAENYVHRTGRTGRAGKKGVALSLVGPRDLGSFRYLRLEYKITPEERVLPPWSILDGKLQVPLPRIGAPIPPNPIAILEANVKGPASEAQLELVRKLIATPDGERILAVLVAERVSSHLRPKRVQTFRSEVRDERSDVGGEGRERGRGRFESRDGGEGREGSRGRYETPREGGEGREGGRGRYESRDGGEGREGGRGRYESRDGGEGREGGRGRYETPREGGEDRGRLGGREGGRWEGRERNEHRYARPERTDRPERTEHRDARPERTDRPERSEHRDARPERTDRPERNEHRDARPERTDRPERNEHRDARPERTDRPERNDRHGQRDGNHRHDRGPRHEGAPANAPAVAEAPSAPRDAAAQPVRTNDNRSPHDRSAHHGSSRDRHAQHAKPDTATATAKAALPQGEFWETWADAKPAKAPNAAPTSRSDAATSPGSNRPSVAPVTAKSDARPQATAKPAGKPEATSSTSATTGKNDAAKASSNVTKADGKGGKPGGKNTKVEAKSAKPEAKADKSTKAGAKSTPKTETKSEAKTETPKGKSNDKTKAKAGKPDAAALASDPVKLTVSLGKSHGVGANDLRALLADAMGTGPESVTSILVRDAQSNAKVPGALVSSLIAALSGKKHAGTTVRIDRA